MHCIESSVSSVSGVTHQSHAAGMPLSRCGADGGADGGADARTASTTTWREKPVSAVGGSAASSRTSFVSDAATEVGEHHPHGPLSRDAISTAPTLHSRSSTPVVPAAPVPADRATGSPQTPCAGGKLHGAWNRFAVFWTQHISVEVPGSAARDHLGVYINHIPNLKPINVHYHIYTRYPMKYFFFFPSFSFQAIFRLEGLLCAKYINSWKVYQCIYNVPFFPSE